jgi:hypothetical protein
MRKLMNFTHINNKEKPPFTRERSVEELAAMDD